MDSLTILALKKAESGGGGGDITVESLSVSQNGEYTAPTGKAYSPVTVAVPQTTVSSLSVTENGTYTATEGTAYSPVTVNVPGGLEYETGTYTPAEDVAQPEISFANTHSDPPILAMMVDASDSSISTAYSMVYWSLNYYDLFPGGSAAIRNYARIYSLYVGSSDNISSGVFNINDKTSDDSSSGLLYWVTKDGIKPGANSSSRCWRSGRTYKWIAVWKPVT